MNKYYYKEIKKIMEIKKIIKSDSFKQAILALNEILIGVEQSIKALAEVIKEINDLFRMAFDEVDSKTKYAIVKVLGRIYNPYIAVKILYRIRSNC